MLLMAARHCAIAGKTSPARRKGLLTRLHFFGCVGIYRYDAQVVPIVHAARKGLKVASVSVAFDASADMKGQASELLRCNVLFAF